MELKYSKCPYLLKLLLVSRNAMRVTKFKFFLFLTSVVFTSCSNELPDNYKVYEESIAPDMGRNVLMCKLGCTSDAKLVNVTTIQWSNSLMYVSTTTSEVKAYYIIKAREGKLACCNQDILIGPLNINEFKRTIVKDRLPEKLEHSNTY